MDSENNVNNNENEERLKNFCLFDDIYSKVFFDGALKEAEQVVRPLLGLNDVKVIECKTQYEIHSISGRCLRLDIKAIDSNGKVFNIEIQRASGGASQKRARYHAAMIDSYLLKSGDDFNKLPEVWIIFISEKDIFKKGKALYKIERQFCDTGKTFGDSSYILYVNGEYKENDSIGNLMHDFLCSEPEKMNNSILSARAKYLKYEDAGVKYMYRTMDQALKDSYDDGMAYGMQQGMQKKVYENALILLKDGRYTGKEIAELLNIPYDEVKNLDN